MDAKREAQWASFGSGDDTVGNPHRAQIAQLECFDIILLLKSDELLPVKQFEATVSVSSISKPDAL